MLIRNRKVSIDISMLTFRFQVSCDDDLFEEKKVDIKSDSNQFVRSLHEWERLAGGKGRHLRVHNVNHKFSCIFT